MTLFVFATKITYFSFHLLLVSWLLDLSQFSSRTHKRNEGRAPVWGSEFTTRAATLQRDSADFAARLNVKFWICLRACAVVELSPLEKLSEKQLCVGGYFFVRSWLCTQERWNPQVANIFGGAARYSRATAGSSPDDAPRILQRSIRVKFSLFRCTSAELFFSCCGSVAAAVTTWAPR